MKTNGRLMMTITALLGSTQAAHAASTSTIYTSGWLVLAFFGLCALVVTLQLIPALIMLAGVIKSMVTSRDTAKVRETN
jgi:hypothetical protein